MDRGLVTTHHYFGADTDESLFWIYSPTGHARVAPGCGQMNLAFDRRAAIQAVLGKAEAKSDTG